MGAPQTIGPYRVERLLGTGGFATVWLAYDPGLDARVAIKVLADNWSHDLRVRERFVAEGRMLWRVDDERVLRVHAVGETDDGRPYLVMAWADRGTLADRLALRSADGSPEGTPGSATPTPDRDGALVMLREIAEAVAVLHRRRIVHRDLTPANVLLRSRPDGTEQVLIGDLGLAKALAAASGLTVGAGTPGYAPPEQLRGVGMVDERADVYALGRLGQALLPDEPPGPLRSLLDASTDADPDRRPADAGAFLAALADAVPAPPAPSVEPAPSARPVAEARPAEARPAEAEPVVVPELSPRRTRRWLVGTVAAAVLLSGGGWLVRDRIDARGRASSGPLSVTLPAGWSSTGQGWAAPGVSVDGPEPALLIASDPASWAGDARVPGAFIGLSPGLTAAKVTAASFVGGRRHGDCAATAPGTWQGAGGAVWSVVTFPKSCADGRVYVEAASDQPRGVVYVQLGLPDADLGLVHTVLDGIRLG